MGKAAKKRPAAAVGSTESETKNSKRHQGEYEKFLIDTVDEAFDNVKYIETLCSYLGLGKHDGNVIPWASAFDGSNAPGQVMKIVKDVLNVKPKHICGCLTEKSYSLQG